MKKLENICYCDIGHERHVLDVYLPDCDTFPVFVFFHGGGISSKTCDKSSYVFYEEFCKRGIAVVTANYRLYPNARYPEFIWDAAAAVAWAYKNMENYGKVSGYFVGGSSAGGYISQMLCFDKKYLTMHNIDSDKVTGYIFDAGQPTVHFNVLAERGMDSKRVVIDEAAPLYHVYGERDYAPMLIFVADNDIPNRYEQTMLLMSTLKDFGQDSKAELHYMENCKHTSYTNKPGPDGKNAFVEITEAFIKKHI